MTVVSPPAAEQSVVDTLAGSLEAFGLPGLLRLLADLRASGTLRLWPALATGESWEEGETGELGFDQGELVAASFGPARGPAAVDALARRQPVGRFSFVPGPPPIDGRNVALPMDALLALVADGRSSSVVLPANVPPPAPAQVAAPSVGSSGTSTVVGRYAGHALIFAGLALFTVLIRSAAGPADALPGMQGILSRPGIGALTQPQPGAMLIANPRTAAVAGVVTAPPAATTEPAPELTVEPTIEPAAPPPAEVQLPAEVAPLPPTDRLVIPRIKLDTKVLDVGVMPSGEMETAAYAAGRLVTSAQAGEAGNMVIAGHDDILGEVFRWLPEVQVGDQFTVYRGDQEFTYRVEIRTIVREDGATVAQRRENAKWMEPVDEPVATLISCYPYRVDTHRIIVRARLVA